MSPAPGRVYLVGAGPGDPELVTVRGLRLVRGAEVIVYDRLGTEALLAEAPPGCMLVDAGKAPGRHGLSQEEITATLVRLAREGRDVVRLKGGDPFVFGRGGEEAIGLAEAGIACEVVPGVSSAVAAPAAVGVPVTHRGLARTVTIASGHDDPASPAGAERWRALAGVPGTLVLLMAMTNLGGISKALVAGGRSPDEPVLVVMEATTARERRLVATLGTVASRCRAEGFTNPAVVVVGAVAALGPDAAAARAREVAAGTPG